MHGAHILAAQRYRLRTMTVHEAMLVVVRQGTKQLHSPLTHIHIGAKEALMIAPNTCWDIINDPAGTPCYEAVVLNFSAATLAHFARFAHGDLSTHARPVNTAQTITANDALQHAIARTLPDSDIARCAPAVLELRLVEVLVHLASLGYVFMPTKNENWVQRVRQLITQHPQQDWSAPALARRLHLSESSLRRRLAPYETSVASLVRETRLEVALNLLQTTNFAVGDIAQRCGWSSHSRFSATFYERWGVSPSVVRTRLTDSEQKMAQNS